MARRLAWNGIKMEPNTLIFKQPGQPRQILRTAMPYLNDDALAATRVPAGHPEGYLEAFANLYKLAIADIRRVESGEPAQGGYPTVYDGLRGMLFITSAVGARNAVRPGLNSKHLPALSCLSTREREGVQ